MTDKPRTDRKMFFGQLIKEIRRNVADVATVRDQVDTFNSLSIPDGYVYVDNDSLIHVVIIQSSLFPDISGLTLARFGSGVAHAADVIWVFDSLKRTWSVPKDRAARFVARLDDPWRPPHENAMVSE